MLTFKNDSFSSFQDAYFGDLTLTLGYGLCLSVVIMNQVPMMIGRDVFIITEIRVQP